MPTPALDLTTYRPCLFHYKMVRPDGIVAEEFDAVNTFVGFDKHRPKSISNPKINWERRASPWWTRCFEFTPGTSGISVLQLGGGWTSVLTGSVISGYFPALDTSRAGQLLGNARLRALGKATDRVMQFNAASRQLKDTMKMVTNASTSLAKGLNKLLDGPKISPAQLKRLERRRKREGKKLDPRWKDAPSKYLEYLYGWKPLADDVANAFDNLGDYSERDYLYSFCLKQKLQETVRDEIDGYTCRYTMPVKLGVSRKSIASVGYFFSLPDWFIKQVPVIAPFSTELELARYSFVVDWFLPISSYVRAMEACQFSPYFRWGFETSAVWEKTDGRLRSNSSNLEVASAGQSLSRMTMNRSVLTSFPYSALTTMPSMNRSLGIDQAAQGLSLLTQVFQRMFR